MHVDNNDLRTLAVQVSRGNRDAKEQLQQQLAPHAARIVRRALRHGSGTAPLTQRVLAVARTAHAKATAESEDLIGQVAGDLCQSLLERLQGGVRSGPGLLA